MSKQDEHIKQLSAGLKSARAATAELTRQLRRTQRAEKAMLRKATLACPGGQCFQSAALAGAAARGGDGAVSDKLAAGVARALAGRASRTMSTAFTGVLRNPVSNLARSIGNSVSRSMGGGLFGGLLGGMLGGGLNLLAGRLFRQKQRVVVDNTVQTEVLNFPEATNLTLAANPASRLFGGRAMVRGPSFTVSIDYRHGAEDLVTAKVAQQLADLNSMQGVI
jgi:hypothetical protein